MFQPAVGISTTPVVRYLQVATGSAVAAGDIVQMDLTLVGYPLTTGAKLARYSVVRTPSTFNSIETFRTHPTFIVQRAGANLDVVPCIGIGAHDDNGLEVKAKCTFAGTPAVGTPLYTKEDSSALVDTADGKLVAILLETGTAGTQLQKVYFFGEQMGGLQVEAP